MFFDVLHGIPRLGLTIKDALELGILIGFDGQLKQESNKEWYMLHDLVKQLIDAKIGGKERALIWLYIKTWNAYGDHLMQYRKYVTSASFWENEEGLWGFDEDDLTAALCIIAYPKKEESRIDRLNSWTLALLDSDTWYIRI